MESSHFDTVVRGFGHTRSRRRTLAALLGALPALLLTTPNAAGEGRRRRGTGQGKRKKGKGSNILVCHSGETLRVPRYAVRAIKRDGGFVGACPPGSPPGAGAGTCERTAVSCRQGQSFRIQCEGDGCNESNGGTTNCPIAHRCTTNGDCRPREYCELRLSGCCGPQPFRTGLCARAC